LQAARAGPILGIDSLRKFRITVAPEPSQVLVAYTVTAPAASKPFLPNVPPVIEALVLVSSATQKIPNSVPDDMKHLLQNFPSILRTGYVMPTPTHGVEHHIHTGSHPSVFAKSHCLDPEKLEIAKAEFKRLESAGIVRYSKSPWAAPLHMVPWRPCGDYAVSIW
jgi:hypothetical protein